MKVPNIGLVLAGSSLVLAIGYSLGRASRAQAGGGGSSASADAAQLVELRAELAQRSARVDELEGELRRQARDNWLEGGRTRMEQELEPIQPIQPVEPEDLAAEPRGEGEPEGASEASATSELPDPQWLRNLDPDRYSDLTAEEAALLRDLELTGGDVSDLDLDQLAALANLRNLSLRGASITDDGLARLSSLWKLESLTLRGTQVSGAGLRYLPGAQLEALHLTDTKVRGQDLAYLPPMPRLETLKLNRLDFGDGDVDLLAAYPNLHHLELDSTGITDAGLQLLMQMHSQLTRVELRDTQISPEMRALMQQLYPNCSFAFN